MTEKALASPSPASPVQAEPLGTQETAFLREAVESACLDRDYFIAQAKRLEPFVCDAACSECGHLFTAGDIIIEDPQAWGHPCHGKTTTPVGACESYRASVPVQAEPPEALKARAEQLLADAETPRRKPPCSECGCQGRHLDRAGLVQLVRDLLAHVTALEGERDAARNLFWPWDNELDGHIYEIRNGRTEEYVRGHVAALIEDATSTLSAKHAALREALKEGLTELSECTACSSCAKLAAKLDADVRKLADVALAEARG